MYEGIFFFEQFISLLNLVLQVTQPILLSSSLSHSFFFDGTLKSLINKCLCRCYLNFIIEQRKLDAYSVNGLLVAFPVRKAGGCFQLKTEGTAVGLSTFLTGVHLESSRRK